MRIDSPFNFTLASKTGDIFPHPSPTRVSRASRPHRARSPQNAKNSASFLNKSSLFPPTKYYFITQLPQRFVVDIDLNT